MKLGNKALELLARSPHVRDWYTDSDGLWVVLVDGKQADSLHSLHLEPCDYSETALRQELASVRDCACRQCARGES